MNLKNQHVVVIGGSSGIGLETARLALELGAQVSVAGRSKDKLAAVKKQLPVNTYALDNRNYPELKHFFSEIGEFDHLFTPAATYEVGPITADQSVAASCFDGKFWVQYMAAKYALPFLKENGSIVFMSGAASQRLPKGFRAAMYVACNSAIEGLVRGLSIELAPKIRVNGVSPGTSATPLWENRDSALREAAYQTYKENCLLEKIGSSVDCAEAVIYLMVNQNTTGSVLFPDGGFTLR